MGSIRTYLANYLWARQNNGIVAVRVDVPPTSAYYIPPIANALETFAWLGVAPDEFYFRPTFSREYCQTRLLSGLLAGLRGLLARSYLCSCRTPTAPDEMIRHAYNNPDDPCAVACGPPSSKALVAPARPRPAGPSHPSYLLRLRGTSVERLPAPTGEPLKQSCANPFIGHCSGDRIGLDGALAILACDLTGGATHILRGRDIASLQAAVNLIARETHQQTPHTYILPIVRFPTGRKLAKSASDAGVLALRDSGFAASEVLNNLFHSLNPLASPGHELSLPEMIEAFDLGATPAHDVHVAPSGLISAPSPKASP